MAGLIATAKTNGAVSVSSSGKTKLGYRAPSTHGVKVKGVKLSFDGTSPTDAKAIVAIRKGTTSAAGTSSAGTLGKISGHTGAVAGACTQDYSAEMTWDASNPLTVSELHVHTQSGLVLPLDLQLNPSEIITVYASSTNTRNMYAEFLVEE